MGDDESASGGIPGPGDLCRETCNENGSPVGCRLLRCTNRCTLKYNHDGRHDCQSKHNFLDSGTESGATEAIAAAQPDGSDSSGDATS